MGRSVPALTGARAASQMASRSYVFGRDDSNSAAPPTDGPSGSTGVCSLYHPDCMGIKVVVLHLHTFLLLTVHFAECDSAVTACSSAL